MKHGYAYNALWINRNARTTRATAFAYWEQASRFEKQARDRGDTAMANYQAQRRVERENQLLAWDACEGGNI